MKKLYELLLGGKPPATDFKPLVAPELFTEPSQFSSFKANDSGAFLSVNLVEVFKRYIKFMPIKCVYEMRGDENNTQIPPFDAGYPCICGESNLIDGTLVDRTWDSTKLVAFSKGSAKRWVAVYGLFGTYNFPLGAVWAYCGRLTSVGSQYNTYLKYVFLSDNYITYGGSFLGCTGLEGLLTLPPTMVGMNYRGFNGCPKITGNLLIPNTLGFPFEVGWVAPFASCGFTSFTWDSPSPKTISSMAASNVWLQGDIFLPDTVKIIADSSFLGCYRLDGNLTMPKQIEVIEAKAFNGCKLLNWDEEFPDTLLTIGDSAFIDCANFVLDANTFLPTNIITIGTDAFRGLLQLSGHLTLPSSIRNLGGFQDCKNLSGTLDIPYGVENIGQYAFSGCTGFSGQLVIPNSVKTISSDAFATTLFSGALIIPNSVTDIFDEGAYYGAFRACVNITSVQLSTSMTKLRRFTFYGCKFKKITIPANIVAIESINNISYGTLGGCFQSNPELLYVDLGLGMASIGINSFADCPKLETVICRNPSPILLEDDSVFRINTTNPKTTSLNLKIYVPDDSISVYQSAWAGISDYASRIYPLSTAPTEPII